jgi:hypothetical protein
MRIRRSPWLYGPIALAIAACAKAPAEPKTPEQLRAAIQAIADRCSPSGKLHFDIAGKETLRFRPDPSADYREVDCFLQKIRAYDLDFQFSGNEAYRD